jgi:hypothetical protein
MMVVAMGVCKVSADTSSGVANISYTLCTGSVRCSDRFFLQRVDASQRYFNYMLARFMAERNLERFSQSDIENNTEMWLEVLCGAWFCNENEIYIESRGCVCENGKSCHEIDNKTGYKELIFVGALSIVVGWCSWNTYYMLRAFLALQRKRAKAVNVINSDEDERNLPPIEHF